MFVIYCRKIIVLDSLKGTKELSHFVKIYFSKTLLINFNKTILKIFHLALVSKKQVFVNVLLTQSENLKNKKKGFHYS